MSIIIICSVILLSYLFDISAKKTKIPSVILLLLLGMGLKYLVDFFHLTPHFDLNPALPILGSIGLLLIVLEGALELELSREKLPAILNSSFIAFFTLMATSMLLALVFEYIFTVKFKMALANVIPISIISSAIAIPSSKYLFIKDREFITYETSLSDILGVIFFNFITLNAHINIFSVFVFFENIIATLLISAVTTIALVYIMGRINHHVKFVPIIICIILIYSISKIFHLPSLVLILFFGLFINNVTEYENISIIKKLSPEKLKIEIPKFKDLAIEMTFLIRSLFFILFGFLMNFSELLNTKTLYWAILVTVACVGIRSLFLILFKVKTRAIFFVSPRGLITILLFLSIPTTYQSPALSQIINKSLISQIIILTSLVMMFGLMQKNKNGELEQS